MEGFGKLKTILNDAQVKAAEECSVLLGQELVIGEPQLSLVARADFFKKRDDPCFVVNVKSTGDYEGEFYLLFTLRDAISMSGFLLGIPPARISEKRKLSIVETDDIDAFSEVINQFIGSFSLVFQPALTGKVHLKVSPPKKFVPDMDTFTDTVPFPDVEHYLFQSPLQLKGQEGSSFYLLMPPELAALYDPPQVEEEEEPEEEQTAEAVGAADETSAPSGEDVAAAAVQAEEGEATVLILDDNVQDRQRVREVIAAKGFRAVEASLDSDMRALFDHGRIILALIGIHDNDDREMAISIKLNALCRGKNLPIIMCARQWTKTSVLKAIRYGAMDIIVKPYDLDDVMAKVGKYLTAA